MALNAAALKMLADKGFTPQEMAQFAALIEDPARSKAAERQARYRQRKSESVTNDVTSDATCDVTSDVTAPPIDNNQTPCSEPNGSGASADPVKELFDLGVEMLRAQGHDERESRSLIGKWRKGRSPGDVVAALVDAKTRSISNLVEWMPKRLNGKGGPGDFIEQYSREIEQRRATA